MQDALDRTIIAGIETNLDWLRSVVRSDAFTSGKVSTRALADIAYTPHTIRVLAGGASTTVQDYPGSLGLWDVGVPPSGPMDALAFRLGNRLLGNPEGAAGLEITAAGPTLLFNAGKRLCLTGADFGATLDGEPVRCYEPFEIAAGQTLKIGRVTGGGMRGYLLIAGGLDVPLYLGSRSAFTLGEFGGHAGRAVMTGDTLHLGHAITEDVLRASWHRRTGRRWRGSGRSTCCTARTARRTSSRPTTSRCSHARRQWKVHYNSSRTGVRLRRAEAAMGAA